MTRSRDKQRQPIQAGFDAKQLRAYLTLIINFLRDFGFKHLWGFGAL